MTTPNSTTNGTITSFSWKMFPVEEEKFSVCLVQSGKSTTKEFSNLCEYMKIIFPEKLVMHDTLESYGVLSGKYTFLKEYSNSSNECPKWLQNHLLIEKYLDNTHVIVIGEFNDIPATVLTNSRIIVFETQEDVNKYLQLRHGALLNNFNTDTNFIVIDKSIMGHFNIYGLSKKDLIRYDKDLRLSP